MHKIWSLFSSIKLTLYLTYAITINVAAGSLILLRNREVFNDIDHMVLADWWMNTGSRHLEATWWIPLLVFLVFLFAVNTLICSIDRLIPIFRRYFKGPSENDIVSGSNITEPSKGMPISVFFPYIAHAGFLIALIGHLVGSVGGYKSYGNLVGEGSAIRVPNSKDMHLILDRFDVRYSGYGYPEEMNSHVRLIEGERIVSEKIIQVNSPLIYNGLAFYVSDFRQASNGRFYVAVDIIKDPGVWILFAGLFIFSTGTILTLFMKKDWAELTVRA